MSTNRTGLDEDLPSDSVDSSWSTSESITATDYIYYTHLIYIPPITISNVSFLFIYGHAQILRTPANCAFAMVAVVNLLMAAVFIPITLAFHIDPNLFKTSFFVCTISEPLRFLLYQMTISMLMILIFDRYIAISHPVLYASLMTIRKILLAAVVIVIIDFLVMIMYIHQLIVHSKRKNDLLNCSQRIIPEWLVIVLTTAYFVKLAISCACTLKISAVAYRSTKQERNFRGVVSLLDKKKYKKTRLIAMSTSALMVMYLVLLLPGHIVFLTMRRSNRGKLEYCLGISFHFMFLNSIINTVAYIISKGAYYTAFIFVLTNRPCNWRQVSRIVNEYHQTHTIRQKKDSIQSNQTNPDEIEKQLYETTLSMNPADFEMKTEDFEQWISIPMAELLMAHSPGSRRTSPTRLLLEDRRLTRHLTGLYIKREYPNRFDDFPEQVDVASLKSGMSSPDRPLPKNRSLFHYLMKESPLSSPKRPLEISAFSDLMIASPPGCVSSGETTPTTRLIKPPSHTFDEYMAEPFPNTGEISPRHFFDTHPANSDVVIRTSPNNEEVLHSLSPSTSRPRVAFSGVSGNSVATPGQSPVRQPIEESANRKSTRLRLAEKRHSIISKKKSDK